MEKARGLLKNLGLLALGLLAALVVVEAGFRAAGALARRGPKPRTDRADFFYLPEGSRDFRDLPHAETKPAGAYRIAVVGDSLSFGPHLQVDDTFPARLERMLNLNREQPRVEVLNYGIPRYSTFHEIETTAQAIREQADLVVLQITLNDAEIRPYRPSGLQRGSVNRFGQVEFTSGIYRHWKTAAFVATRLYNARSRRGYEKYHFDLFMEDNTWNHFEDSVRKIEALCKEAKVPLVAVVFPLFGLPLDESYPFLPIHEKVGALLKKDGVPALDLYPAYARIPVIRLQMIPGTEFHPNEIANRIAAESIYLWLESRGLVPEKARIRNKFKERIDIRLEKSERLP